MATVFDAARYVLKELREGRKLPITTWKLQKLVYYCQAWSLVWDDEPLFSEQIEAWADGPVCPALYQEHRGQYKISSLSKGSISNLKTIQKETIEAVVAHYGKRTAQFLSELTHRERPWKDARQGIPLGAPSNNVITHEAMAEYYASLL